MRAILAIIRLFDRQPKSLIIVLALASLVPIGLLDALVGHRVVFAFFYLVPITFVTWHVSPRWGALFSVLCAAIWGFATTFIEETHGYVWIPYWDTVSQLGVFLLVTLLLSTLRAAQDREAALARTDALTGTANRLWFREQLDREILRGRRYHRPFTVIYGDLDNFKAVNDQFGHEVGDALLREVAAALHAGVRTTDTVARLGGDEFAILLPETNQEAGRVVTEELRRRIREAMRRHGWSVTGSFGVVTCVTPPTNTDVLLAFADQLMYTAKRESKGGVRHAVLADVPA